MASTASHTAASSNATSHAPASTTYRTQSLPVAVPLPDFWHQQRRPSPSNAAEYAVEQQQSRHALQHSQHNSSMTRDALLDAASSHPAWTASSSARSHQQLHHQQPSHKSSSSSAPLAYSQPPHPHQQQQQQQQQSNAYYAQPPSSSCYYREPASAGNSLPIHHHYPVASTSSSKGLVSNSTASTISSLHGPVVPKTQAKARAASPALAKKVPSNRNRSATIEVQHQKSEGSYKGGPTSGPDTPTTYQEGDDGEEEIDEDPELTARFSSVSQIEAQPTLDPDTGEAIYPCPFCDKSYGGKHARSIWRRHLSNKHGIPLNLQPRRTRWDNDVNRPKDEAERHKRTLESKRRWAAKNRAEKRAKRKGTTVEEELGLIEAAEAAGNHSGSIGQDEENDHPGDESFNASEISVSFSQAPGQNLHQPYSVQERQNWQDQSHNNVQQQQQQQQSVPLSHVQYAASGSIQHPQNGFSSVPLDNAPPPHQIRYLQPQTNYGESTYTEGDAGHQASYTLVYPTFSLPPSAPSEARQYQRSPSQPEFISHIQQQQHQGNMHYAPSVSPLDGSFQLQSQQPVYHVQQGQSQNMVQPVQHSRILQTAPLLQQPFLAPPPLHQAPSLQRSASAPIPQAMPLSREHTPLHASQLRTNDEVQPATHAQIAYARQPAVPTRFVNELQQSPAQQNGIVPNGRPTSANGMSIYIPPPPQGMQAWTQQSNQQHQQHYQQQHQQQQNTPLAHPAHLYTQNGTQQPQQPPTPYYYLSVPDSTPVTEHQLPVSNVLQPVPMHVSMQPRQQQLSPSIQPASVPAASIPETAGIAQVPALEAIRSVVEPAAAVPKTKRRKESKKKSTIVATESSNSTTTGKASKKKAATTVGEQTKTNTREGESIPQAVQLTKTYQEAAMQLLALASSSPPPSPVKELNDPLEYGDDDDDVEREDRSRSMDGEGSSYAEDSGYVHFGEDSLVNYKSSNNGTRGQYKAGETQQGQEDEEEEDDDAEEERRRSLRFADVPPSSPAQLRMSLSPESSPLPMVAPSKLSATYLRAQASAGRSTPIGMKRKYTMNNIQRDGGETVETDENAVEEDNDEDEDGDEEGERISLDSSPEREDLEMKAPISKRSRLISMSSVSPGGRDRQRLGLRKGTSSITTSRSPSPNRYINSGMSSFATSVIMSTPHQHQHMGTMGNQGQARMDKKDSSSSIPSGLFSFAQGMGISKSGASEKEHVEPKRHAHRTSIFKIDNCSRPSAGLGMIGTTSYSSSNNNNHSNSNIPSLSSSSPSRPYLLSSPEHAAVSKSLGLVPDNYNHNKLNNICLPSDGEGFEMHFLRGFGGNNDMNGRDGENGKESNTSSRIGKNGLSEYAKDVFGGYL